MVNHLEKYLSSPPPPEDERPDYLAHVGVKGMKWGVRRSREERAAASGAKKTESSGKKDDDAPKQGSSGSGSSSKATTESPKDAVGESSSARYDRISAQARAGGANSISEADLKFYTARTDAIAKVNKMNEVDPGWLSKTSKKVLQNTAEQSMQSVSNAIAGKYISGPVIAAIQAGPKKPATND